MHKTRLSLIFRRHILKLGQGEDRTVLAHELVADIAAAAHADTALHAHFKGEDDPLRGEPHFFQDRLSKLDHDRRA